MTRYVQNFETPKKEPKKEIPAKPKPGQYTSKNLEGGKKIYSGNGGKY